MCWDANNEEAVSNGSDTDADEDQMCLSKKTALLLALDKSCSVHKFLHCEGISFEIYIWMYALSHPSW